jgi:hypothetical protein
MFDSNKPFRVKIMSGGERWAVLRWPTDQEWIARARKQALVQRASGVSEVPDLNEANATLITATQQESDGQPFDEFEATKLVTKIERCDVLDVNRSGEVFEVKMSVPGGEVTHKLRIPSVADAVAYRRAAADRKAGRRRVTITINLEPTLKLWEKVTAGVEGYAQGSTVPVIHKDVAVTELLNELEEIEDTGPED